MVSEEISLKQENIYEEETQPLKVATAEVCRSISHHSDVKKPKHNSYLKLLRFLIIGALAMITFFLLSYSTYLVVIQYMANITNKYNKKYFEQSKIFFEIDVMNYRFNTSCSFKSYSIICLLPNLKKFHQNGVTDLILRNAFDQNYQLKSEFTDEAMFKKLIRKSTKYHLGIYLDIDKKPKNWISGRDTVSKVTDYSSSANNSCVDSYCDDILAIIENFAQMGVDGFVINDIPCCVMFPQYFKTDSKNCTFTSFKAFRKVARKVGKPSALIYRPDYHMYETLMNALSEADCSYLDAIIKYIDVDKNGDIKVADAELKSTLFPHVIYTIKSNFNNDSEREKNGFVYQSPALFFTGSYLLSGYHDKESNSSSGEDIHYQNFKDDMQLISLASSLKTWVENVSCVSNFSAFIPKEYGDSIFLAVQEILNEPKAYCTLVINLSDKETSVNIRSRSNETEYKTKKSLSAIKVFSNSVELIQEPKPKSTINIEPHSAQVVKL